MHASLESRIDEILILICAQAANIWTLVYVLRVISAFFNNLNNLLSSFNSIDYWHAIVHENELIWLDLSTCIDIIVPLFDHSYGLITTDCDVGLNSQISQKHLQHVQ